ncbi:MAG: hypothetical protein DRG78_01260 [Epsilonproteobacteria bacterium]|nr:MAG: hypothetical protein DRG78_01260 [Campylobacterota bacterium]
MTNDILKSLDIPKECYVNKPIFKKMIRENFTLNSSEKKILENDISNIKLEYILNKNNINISQYIDEDNKYLEINFLKVEISNINKLKQITTILQNIPKPLIIFFAYKNSLCINISPKRLSKSTNDKLVIEENYFTHWINLAEKNNLEKEFIDSLNINNQSFTNFLSFYTSYLDKILSLNASKFSGTLNINKDTKAILDDIATIEISISELKSKIKKETNFSDKVNMNIELKKLNDKLKDLKGSL